ncbi:HNH endonuclease [Pseudobutyrivibrio sp. ACV-2]|uniref:HNH endonuclease n=1 Tax=Pseudobutyrivibrio sp. ACV-2 TaxID=1520801 RepID=UPI0008974957|nr:HNH endonuclease signature motif containing protein [Pseudobutyrivibrio sp. ACV-2]SEA88827.1 HNH endonuclease [Pseudobutyrivibrio sp. ACV-2]
MEKHIEAEKICNITDEVTKIRYKIVHKKTPNRYEIYTQYTDDNGVFRRNRILFKEAKAVEADLQKTIAYVNDYLVAKHINIYEDENYMGNRDLTRAKRTKPLSDDHTPEEICKHARELDLEDLKIVAEQCANCKEIKIEARTERYRNIYIAEYAKRKANGICLLCNKPAPFKGKDGTPYLESHHILWLSKGGEDAIDNVVALCPNCHKKMHIINDAAEVEFLINKAKE